ncbi:MAG TPA: hypothetical protein VLA31_01940 [Burkholderiaceae bacterium]|nr:hypothetical protein [Burkholderiaceae bacterium]
MIAPEREFLQSWQDLHYPPGPEMPEEPQPVQVAQAGGGLPEMKAYDPTTRERLASFLQSGFEGIGIQRAQARRYSQSLIGGESSGLPLGLGVADIVPFLGTALQTEEAARMGGEAVEAAKRGDVGEAAMLGGLAAVGMVPGAAGTVKAARSTAKFVKPKVGEMLSDYMSRSGLTPELMAFHGTPARFAAEEGAPLGRFRSEKIGTGEGAQAYGYGLYFAEDPNVARRYRMGLTQDIGQEVTYKGKSLPVVYEEMQNKSFKLTGKQADIENQKLQIIEHMMLDKSPEELVAYAKDAGFDASVVSWIEKDVSKNIKIPGSLYTVDVPDDVVVKMLDYDKPLSSQPAELQSKLKSVVDSEVGPGVWESWIKNEPDFRNLKDDLLDNKTDAEVSALLREAGIPGIRYLDEGSRGVGEGTRNIVVFPGEEDKVKILKVE